MGYLKEKSSLRIFDRHTNLKYKFGNKKLWVEGYSHIGCSEPAFKQLDHNLFFIKKMDYLLLIK